MKYQNPITKKIRYLGASIVLSAVIMTLSGNAQSNSESKTSKVFFDVFAGLEFREVGNANRTSDKNLEIDELQTRTNLAVFGAYQGDVISRAQISYDLSHDSFSEDTQDDDSSLDGEASLMFGDATKHYDINLTHSSRTLLVDPEEADLTSNRDDRNIFTAIGTLRTSPNKKNVFSVGASTTKVKYKEFSINDSTRNGLNTNYTRLIGPITSAGINLSVTDIDFDTGNNADYKYKRASLFFSRKLRQLSYDLSIGKYETELVSGEEDSGPFSSFNASYSTGPVQFSLAAERDITDTSLGNNNSELFSDDTSVDGRIGTQDQIIRKYLSAGVAVTSLCVNCIVRLEAGKEDEAYFNLTQESSESKFIRASASYSPASKVKLALNANRSDFSYTERTNPNNYTFTVLRASVGISDILRNLNTGIFVESLERKFDQSEGYKSLSYGFRLDYQFY